MRVILDGTPLLGTRTGIGRYAAELLGRLPSALETAAPGSALAVTLWSARGRTLGTDGPDVRVVGPRVPARLLRECWTRSDFPPVEALVGSLDVFHGTNFVAPPTKSAAEVVTVHDLSYLHHADTVSRDSLAYRELVPRALRRGAHVVTPTRAVADAIAEEYSLTRDRIHVTPLGVDARWSDAAPADEAWLGRRGLPRDYLLFVGSLDPRKNLPRLIQAHRRAVDERAGVPDLVLAGPAGRESRIDDEPGVHLTGWLEKSELTNLVAGARGLVLPSLDEGFGLPVIEALACGRPVLVSDIPALREAAGPSAVTCEPLSIPSISEGLLALAAQPDGDCDRGARRRWAAAFTWDRTAGATVEAYLAATADR